MPEHLVDPTPKKAPADGPAWVRRSGDPLAHSFRPGDTRSACRAIPYRSGLQRSRPGDLHCYACRLALEALAR